MKNTKNTNKWTPKEVKDLLNVRNNEGIYKHIAYIARKYNRSPAATRIKYYKMLNKNEEKTFSSSIVRKKRWTEKEDNLIRKAVSEDASNLSEQFHDLSSKLDRTYLAINHRYYSKIRHSDKALFSLIDKRGIHKNTKNGKVKRLYKKGFFKEILEKILAILK